MALPELSNWEKTREALHQATQVIGGVRRAVAEPEPNWAHLGLQVVPEGLTTGPLLVGECRLHFPELKIRYLHDGRTAEVPIAGHSQRSLADALEAALAAAGHENALDRGKITGETPLEPDRRTATEYAGALNLIWQALGRFRSSLPGDKSPLVLWPHGFDAAFLWFAQPGQTSEEEDPHMGFGFSPGSAGLARPYFYSYPRPVPDGLGEIALPPGVRLHTQGWTGTVLDYDAVSQSPDPAAAIQDSLRATFEAVSPLLARGAS